MAYNYSIKNYEKERMARIVGRALPISTKQSIELCMYIRNKSVKEAKVILEDIIKLKKAVPFKRFKGDLGHKKKIGPGRYPVKVTTAVLRLIEGIEANAQFKGLNTNELFIFHIKADKASRQWHYGRKRSRKMKRTNIEIIVEERKVEEKETKNSKRKKVS